MKVTFNNQKLITCIYTRSIPAQLSLFSRECLSFSLNLPVSQNAFWVIFGGYSWTLSLMTFSQCKDFETSPDFCTLGVGRYVDLALPFHKIKSSNLRRCPSEKNSYVRCLQGNPHKLYIKRKVIKCRIR